MLQDEDQLVSSEADLAVLTGHHVQFTAAIPPGELLGDQSPAAQANARPLCYISDHVPRPQLLAQFRADHRRTGLWPLLLSDESEVYGDRCTVGVARREPMDHIERWTLHGVMSRIWDGLCQADSELGPAYDLDVLAPFDYTCPSPAKAGSFLVDPDLLANKLAGEFVDEESRLGLVPIARGADVLTALGWSGASNHVSRTAGLCAMLRSWEDRFGARVLRLGPDRLDLSVAAPPQDLEHAQAVAAEHWTFCPDRILQESGTISDYAKEIRGKRTWNFWWD